MSVTPVESVTATVSGLSAGVRDAIYTTIAVVGVVLTVAQAVVGTLATSDVALPPYVGVILAAAWAAYGVLAPIGGIAAKSNLVGDETVAAVPASQLVDPAGYTGEDITIDDDYAASEAAAAAGAEPVPERAVDDTH